MSKKQKVLIENLAAEFHDIDCERLELERRVRELKKRMHTLQESIQEYVGVADTIDVPLVTRIGKFLISQIRKHRQVSAYECNFVEFKIVALTQQEGTGL